MPSLTPTLGPPITRTPAPAAECPKPSGATQPPLTLDTVFAAYLNPEEMKPDAGILGYLNIHGSAVGLEEAITSLPAPLPADFPPQTLPAHVFIRDVTNDTVPDVIVEIVFPEGGGSTSGLWVFACNEGRYESISYFLLGDRDNDEGHLKIEAIRDMNLNGVREIVLRAPDLHGGDRLFILEWNGTDFASMVEYQSPDFEWGGNYGQPVYWIPAEGPVVITDTDGNGTLEVVVTMLSLEFTIAPMAPDRDRIETWAWNGYVFTLVRTHHSPPKYRFQAVLDGDEATGNGRYAEALTFYQQAIFDEKLWEWSQGYDPYSSLVTPAPNPDERARLSAYARYRIALLHIVQGNLREAQVVYDALQSKFPAGAVGHQYAELAKVVWEEYQASQSVAAACGKAIDYASAHADEILIPLGSAFYLENNRNYVPEDICPFK